MSTKFPANPMSTQPESHPSSPFDDEFFQQSLPQVYRSALRQFRKITTFFVFFNVLSIAFLAVETLLFLFFFPLLMRSALLIFSLSGLFLTVFSYFVLLFYYQAKKPEQLIQLKNEFLSSSRRLLSIPAGEAQHHLSIAAALIQLASYLETFEWQFTQNLRFFRFVYRLLSKLSLRCHWQDVFRLQQILYHAAIDEQLCQIRITPTDLELHASLANTYIALSRLFMEPKKHSSPASLAYRKKSAVFLENHRIASHLAIEELQILNSYASQDPWVHEQLAAGYRDLQMKNEEIQEIEILLRLRPQDQELLCRLGTLYFSQGLNAKGLSIYEKLKLANYKKAEDLITAYGQRKRIDSICEIL